MYLSCEGDKKVCGFVKDVRKEDVLTMKEVEMVSKELRMGWLGWLGWDRVTGVS